MQSMLLETNSIQAPTSVNAHNFLGWLRARLGRRSLPSLSGQAAPVQTGGAAGGGLPPRPAHFPILDLLKKNQLCS